MTWIKILNVAIKRNGWKQFFFYLSNLDECRFIEISKTLKFFDTNGGNILELGCGYSVLPTMMSESNNKYLVLDLSINACRYQKGENIGQVAADMSRLPFKPSSISNLIALSSIEHVPNDHLVFREIARVLKKGGTAIISVPLTDGPVEVKNLKHSRYLLACLVNLKPLWRLILGDDHLNYFLEQTTTDSIIKYYNKGYIDDVMSQNNLYIEQEYVFEKLLQKMFWRYVPRGWFVVKDLCFGWILNEAEERLFRNSYNGNGILLKVRKR